MVIRLASLRPITLFATHTGTRSFTYPYRPHSMAQQQSIARFFCGKPKTGSSPTKAKESTKSPIKQQTLDQLRSPTKADQLPVNGDDRHVSKIRRLDDGKVELSHHDEAEHHSGLPAPQPQKTEESDHEATPDEAAKLLKMLKEVPLEKLGAKIPYAKITATFDRIEATLLRLEMTAIVAQFFLDILRQLNPKMLTRVLYLFINRLGPDYEPGLELGLGETLLIKAISECYGRASTKIKLDYKEEGDLGKVAQKLRLGQPTMFKPQPLDVDTVFENLTRIAKTTGKDAQNRKIGLINKMLTACDSKLSEAKFLVRLLEGKLRIGLAGQTVLVALAQAFCQYENKRTTPEQLAKAEEIFKEAYSQIPNYEVVIHEAYEHGIAHLLEHCKLTPGIPLKPMLAKPTKAITEILDRFQGEEFTCEYKYDGERAQVHVLEDGSVRIYSRNLEDMLQRYPDLVAIMTNLVATQGILLVVLDCEAVAWDRVQEKILPFQVLLTRKRKDVKEGDITVNICLFMFDMLYYGGEPLITKLLAERRELMQQHFTPIEGQLQFATAKNLQSLDELQVFLDQLVKDLCEGLMVKMLHGSDLWYEPLKRSRNWLKLKKDYLAGVGDSLDLVVVGAYYGRGKRTGAYGGFLLALYNEDSGEYETTCKIGTGFSDEMLAELYQKLKPTEISQPKPFYVYDTTNSNAKPDVWLEPTMLFEVLTADLSLSPIYKAAHSEYGKGISLRFPRFIRIRDDKGPEDATSSTQVAEFYERQASVQ